jgi:hypothetical protein
MTFCSLPSFILPDGACVGPGDGMFAAGTFCSGCFLPFLLRSAWKNFLPQLLFAIFYLLLLCCSFGAKIAGQLVTFAHHLPAVLIAESFFHCTLGNQFGTSSRVSPSLLLMMFIQFPGVEPVAGAGGSNGWIVDGWNQ